MKSVRSMQTLEDLPNVGKSIAGDFRLMGIHTPGELRGKDAFALYKKLCRKTGQRQDPCVLDTFLAVIHFMDGGPALPWWKFTGERKRKYHTV